MEATSRSITRSVSANIGGECLIDAGSIIGPWPLIEIDRHKCSDRQGLKRSLRF